MGTQTAIEWTQGGATWNPWQGCTKVSQGCRNCYMYRDMIRYGKDPRTVVRSARPTFEAPLKWARYWQNPTDVKNVPPKPGSFVFTCSWSDWFHVVADDWRDDAWKIARDTPFIYLVLTKRAYRIEDHLPADWGEGYPNVWLGVSVEDQGQMERAEILGRIPAAKRFISYEPALGPLEFSLTTLSRFHWLISGGESGSGFRKADPDWFTSVRDQCRHAEVSYFHKQNGGTQKIDGSWGGHLLDGKEYREFPNG